MSAIGTFKVMARCFGRRRVPACGCWIVLIALALPAWAQEDVLINHDRQVRAIVERVKPAVVSVRVGPPRKERASDLFPPAAPVELPVIEEMDWDSSILLTGLNGSANLRAPSKVQRGAIEWDNNKLLMRFQPTRVGTGFVVDAAGIVVTTADVVGDSKEVTVELGDGRAYGGKVLGADALTGVAVVKVEAMGLPVVRLSEGKDLGSGQLAIIIGNQLDRGPGVWVGRVTRTDARVAGNVPQGRLLAISNAPAGPGASGAPVVSAGGEVIGIVFASSSPWARLGAADAAAAAKLAEKFEKNSAEIERRAERLSEAAERLGKRAEARAAAAAKKQELEAKKQGKESPEQEAERERRQEELERRLEKWGEELEAKLEARGEKMEAISEQLGEKLGEQMELAAKARSGEEKLTPVEEQRLRRLEAEVRRLKEELQREQQAMNRELSRINELLPQIPGVREIAIELGPEIARVVAEAQAIAAQAVQPLIEAEPDPDPNPNPAVEPAAPAAPADPGVVIAPAAPGVVVAAPAEVRVFAGSAPGAGAVTYAIPISTARWAITQIRENGRVAHPYLGVSLDNLDAKERERLKAPPEARVRVTEVRAGSAAQAAGLQKDDLILEFQGQKIEEAGALTELMRGTRVGDQVSLVIWRSGERRTVQAKLGERPRDTFRFNVPFAQPFPVPQPPAPGNFRFDPPRVQPSPPVIFRGFPGRVTARAEGTGRNARVTLEAQDAPLEGVLRELSRATGLGFSADEKTRQKRITLKVEGVPVNDLVESLERLYRLRTERRGDRITFRAR